MRKQFAGLPLVVSEHIDPNPEWWVRSHWWLDEEFRAEVNGNLFQAFGHLVKPTFYKVDNSALAIPPLVAVSGGGETLITNEVGAHMLREVSDGS